MVGWVLRVDEMEDLVAMSNELGESIGRSYEVPDCMGLCLRASS